VITEEERTSIVNEAVEKALLALPDVIGNLIMHQTNLIKSNREFYKSNPEFASSKDVVSSVIEKFQLANPNLDYAEILKQAIPAIKERIKTVRGLDTVNVGRPNRDLKQISFPTGNGEL
jgi:hypothetical protein